MREINEAGKRLIIEFEGLRLEPYRDSAGYLTIGIGHLIRPGEHFTRITAAQAEAMLNADLASARSAVERLAQVPLGDNQFAALVSFTYNLGSGALERSTLLKLVNDRAFARAADEFVKWSRVHDPKTGRVKVVDGLTRRREAEARLFITP
jgi:lysozyme